MNKVAGAPCRTRLNIERASSAAVGAGKGELADKVTGMDARRRKRRDEDLPHSERLVPAAVLGIFLILFIALLYFAKAFFLPVSLAFLLALVFSPIVRSFRNRGIPEVVSAIFLVSVVFVGLSIAAYGLRGPLTSLIENAPTLTMELKTRVATWSRPIQRIFDTTGKPENGSRKGNKPAQETAMPNTDFLHLAASSLPSSLEQIGVTLILLIFLLASGDMFYEKLVKSIPSFRDKLKAVRIARNIERDLSHFLFTITVINAGLGIAIGIAMTLTGLPNPNLWGAIAAVFNFVPYIGAITGITLVSLISLVSFPDLTDALWPPLAYVVIAVCEGQFITPLIIGRRLELNVVAIFMAVAFWTWLWGLVGAFMAVPMLVTIKVFADHVDGLNGLGAFLAARDEPPAEADER